MVRLGKADPKVVAITAAMPDGTGLVDFSKELPGQFYDVGMCEQHAVGLAAGLAKGGMKPFAVIYSTFLQRGYDQVIHDACIQNLPVIFTMDRAGLVGDDGITHHGVFDIAYMLPLPRMTFMAAKDLDELEAMLDYCAQFKSGPIAVRYPRGSMLRFYPELQLTLPAKTAPIELGKAEILTRGSELAIVAVGSMVYPALEAAAKLSAKGISTTVVNVRFLKPIELDFYANLAKEHRAMLIVEEGVLTGGFGPNLMSQLSGQVNGTAMSCMGIPDKFFEHGKREILLNEAGLTTHHIEQAAEQLLDRKTAYAR
jgi:1-deoxy-D-xylulose-5-phosphate synthase